VQRYEVHYADVPIMPISLIPTQQQRVRSEIMSA
jgi:hypothetical protein